MGKIVLNCKVTVLQKYIQQSNETQETTEEKLKEKIERKRTGDYQSKPLRGQFKRDAKEDEARKVGPG